MDFSRIAHELVETAYEGIVADKAFDHVVRGLNRLNMGGVTSFMFMNPNSLEAGLAATVGMSAEAIALYEAEYSREDPGVPWLSRIAAGGRLTLNEFVPKDQLVKSRYYNEYARKQILDTRNYHTIATTDQRVQTAVGIMTCNMAYRYEERVSDGVERMLGLLQPHLKRVMALRQQRRAVEVNLFVDMVHGLKQPSALLALDGRVLSLNAAAETAVTIARAGGLYRPQPGPAQVDVETLSDLARSMVASERVSVRRAVPDGAGRPMWLNAVRLGGQSHRISLVEARYLGTSVPAVFITLEPWRVVPFRRPG